MPPDSPEPRPVFDFERLPAYHHALDAIATIDVVCDAVPVGRAYVVQQLRDSALSVCLNIAEGSGEVAAAEKRRLYRIALRSAAESAAGLGVLVKLGLASPESIEAPRRSLLNTVAILTRMIHNLGNRRESSTLSLSSSVSSRERSERLG